jgi:hypothetical protein
VSRKRDFGALLLWHSQDLLFRIHKPKTALKCPESGLFCQFFLVFLPFRPCGAALGSGTFPRFNNKKGGGMEAGDKWWSWFGLLAGKFKERALLRWILKEWNESLVIGYICWVGATVLLIVFGVLL